jgi:ribose-phosphate pyrophosphokinase
MQHKNKVRIFALNNSVKIGKKVCHNLGIRLSPTYRTVFKDGEILTGPSISVRDKNIFVICSSSRPVNSSIMETLIFIDALKRASARTVVVVMTYYGYARQDRKNSGRQPISAKLHADLLMRVGMTKLITVDLHNASIQGFFDSPVDDLRGQYVLATHVDHSEKYVVVSPDHGGVVRANILAKLISGKTGDPEIAIIDKTRTGPNQSKIRGILGNVKNRNCLIVDDMIDTGGTIIQAAEALKKEGAKKVVIMATHGLFSKGFDAFEKSSAIDRVYITDSLEHVHSIKSSKLTIVSLSGFISEVISATYGATSITSVYTNIAKKIKTKKS